ncbi:MAG: thioredoxin domain-containing protein, partial [Pseudomonadota bacterium]|nr:thioredoxin domain-containing protein [Pseudomonadota bacterium]
VDQNQATAQGLNVRNLPTLMIFKDGQPVAMMAGAQPKSSIKQWIERNI